jgi:carbonic anhydrase/acetyltransferase-like protein (isoleucine patch superfamily)
VISSFRGVTPEVHDDAWVADTATLLGAVAVGARSSVWLGTVVRADVAPIRIGEDTNLQDNCTLHADPGAPLTIGDRVTVGHAAVLHGCTVGSDVLVGMAAVVLNRARIGAGSIVAAGAVVLEDTDIPPGSLVAGVPAKVRRGLTDAERERVGRNAAAYVELAREHRAAT